MPPFLTELSIAAAKIESTPYTHEAIASSDFTLEVMNLEYSKEIKEFQRKLLDGTLDSSPSIMGKQMGTINFTTTMNPGAAVNTEPTWAKFLKACGFKQTAHGSTGISWVPHADTTCIPISMEVQERNCGASPSLLSTNLGGCMGEVTFLIGEVGEPVQMNFEFSGALRSVIDKAFASMLTPGTVNTTKAAPVIGTSLTVNSIAQIYEKWEIKTGNTVSPFVDPGRNPGYRGFFISKRGESTLTIDPYADLLANDPVYTDWLAGNTGAVSSVINDGTNPIITLSAPAAQYSTVNPGEREGGRTSEKVFRLHKSAGNDSFEILQGAKS